MLPTLIHWNGTKKPSRFIFGYWLAVSLVRQTTLFISASSVVWMPFYRPAETVGFHTGVMLSSYLILHMLDWVRSTLHRKPPSPSGIRLEFRFVRCIHVLIVLGGSYLLQPVDQLGTRISRWQSSIRPSISFSCYFCSRSGALLLLFPAPPNAHYLRSITRVTFLPILWSLALSKYSMMINWIANG